MNASLLGAAKGKQDTPQPGSLRCLYSNKSPAEIDRSYFHKSITFQLNKKQEHGNDPTPFPALSQSAVAEGAQQRPGPRALSSHHAQRGHARGSPEAQRTQAKQRTQLLPGARRQRTAEGAMVGGPAMSPLWAGLHGRSEVDIAVGQRNVAAFPGHRPGIGTVEPALKVRVFPFTAVTLCPPHGARAKVTQSHPLGGPPVPRDNGKQRFQSDTNAKMVLRTLCPSPCPGGRPSRDSLSRHQGPAGPDGPRGSQCPPCPRGPRARDAPTPEGTEAQNKAGKGPN